MLASTGARDSSASHSHGGRDGLAGRLTDCGQGVRASFAEAQRERNVSVGVSCGGEGLRRQRQVDLGRNGQAGAAGEAAADSLRCGRDCHRDGNDFARQEAAESESKRLAGRNRAVRNGAALPAVPGRWQPWTVLRR